MNPCYAAPTLAALTLAWASAGCGAGADWPGGIHARMGWSDSGLRVVEVPEGPARRGGLSPGDQIAAIDGIPVTGRPMEEVVHMLRGEVGTTVELSVLREGQRLNLQIERAPYGTAEGPAAP